MNTVLTVRNHARLTQAYTVSKELTSWMNHVLKGARFEELSKEEQLIITPRILAESHYNQSYPDQVALFYFAHRIKPLTAYVDLSSSEQELISSATWDLIVRESPSKRWVIKPELLSDTTDTLELLYQSFGSIFSETIMDDYYNPYISLTPGSFDLPTFTEPYIRDLRSQDLYTNVQWLKMILDLYLIDAKDLLDIEVLFLTELDSSFDLTSVFEEVTITSSSQLIL